MELLRWLLALFLLIICLMALGGAISIGMNFYNSEDSVSMGLSGENLKYGAAAQLLPDSLLFDNGGSSTQSQCSYDYHVTFDGRTIESGAQTNNGVFSWGTLVDADSKGDGSRTFRVSAKNAVKDGALKSHYGNPDLKVDATTQAVNSAYTQAASITSNTLVMQGSGGTTKDINAADSSSSINSANNGARSGEDIMDENTKQAKSDPLTVVPASGNTIPIQGVDQTIRVIGSDKTGSLVVQVLGETNVAWMDKIVSDRSRLNFGTTVQGTSKFQMSKLGMEGKATNFPTQILPPGNVKITSKTQTELDLENLQKYIAEQGKAFSEKYPQPITNPLWYYLKESAFVNPIPSDPSAPANIPQDCYFMSMGFGIRNY